MTTEIDVPMGGALKALAGKLTPAERAKFQQHLSEQVTDERYDKPVPRWVLELPQAGDDDEVQARIASALLVAENPDTAQTESGSETSKELLNRQLTVWDLRASKSRKEGGVGAFLILDVTEGDDEVHKVVTTGAIQAMARLARCWADDQLPVTGAFAAVPGTGDKGTPVITFIVETAF